MRKVTFVTLGMVQVPIISAEWDGFTRLVIETCPGKVAEGTSITANIVSDDKTFQQVAGGVIAVEETEVPTIIRVIGRVRLRPNGAA